MESEYLQGRVLVGEGQVDTVVNTDFDLGPNLVLQNIACRNGSVVCPATLRNRENNSVIGVTDLELKMLSTLVNHGGLVPSHVLKQSLGWEHSRTVAVVSKLNFRKAPKIGTNPFLRLVDHYGSGLYLSHLPDEEVVRLWSRFVRSTVSEIDMRDKDERLSVRTRNTLFTLYPYSTLIPYKINHAYLRVEGRVDETNVDEMICLTQTEEIFMSELLANDGVVSVDYMNLKMASAGRERAFKDVKNKCTRVHSSKIEGKWYYHIAEVDPQEVWKKRAVQIFSASTKDPDGCDVVKPRLVVGRDEYTYFRSSTTQSNGTPGFLAHKKNNGSLEVVFLSSASGELVGRILASGGTLPIDQWYPGDEQGDNYETTKDFRFASVKRINLRTQRVFGKDFCRIRNGNVVVNGVDDRITRHTMRELLFNNLLQNGQPLCSWRLDGDKLVVLVPIPSDGQRDRRDTAAYLALTNNRNGRDYVRLSNTEFKLFSILHAKGSISIDQELIDLFGNWFNVKNHIQRINRKLGRYNISLTSTKKSFKWSNTESFRGSYQEHVVKTFGQVWMRSDRYVERHFNGLGRFVYMIPTPLLAEHGIGEDYAFVAEHALRPGEIDTNAIRPVLI